MEIKSKDPSQPLERKLLENGRLFSFFQTVRLLKRLSSDGETPGATLRIRPDLSFDYPESDVASVRHDAERNRYEILTSFLGLYGVSSPLPAFYTEDLIDAELEDRSTARALLDIVHQRLFTLFFSAQKKYRPLYGMTEDGASDYVSQLFSLLGLREKTLLNRLPAPHRLLRYIGLFSQKPRSALGLKTLLEDAFDGMKTDVTQCVPRNVKIPPPQRLNLGKGAALIGVNAILGEEIEDRCGKIKISIGPLTRKRFQEIINTADQWTALVFLIQYYLTDPLECDLELILAENEAETTQLGVAAWSCLGQNAWLFSSSFDGRVYSRFHVNVPDKSVLSSDVPGRQVMLKQK